MTPQQVKKLGEDEIDIEVASRMRGEVEEWILWGWGL